MDEQHDAPSSVRRRQVAPDRYGLVLGLLTVSYVLYALSVEVWVQLLTAGMLLVALVLAVQTSAPSRRLSHGVRVVAGVGAALTVAAAVTLPRTDAVGVMDATFAVVLAMTLVAVLRRVIEHRDVTLRSIAAALSGYLLLGMVFTHVFGLLDWLDGPFFADGTAADGRTLQYFSFTTLTTLGYGDLTAATYAGRGLATLEALVAQVYLVTIVARLVASWRAASPATPPSDGGGRDEREQRGA